MRTTLLGRFIDHLRAGAPAESSAFASALRAEGYVLEGSLLERDGWTDGVAAGPWVGRRAFVGRRPPDDANPGELWLDTVEASAMVLVEEPSRRQDRPPERTWLAIRPVARWQFRAFAEVAPIVGRPVQVEPKLRPMDRPRLEAGPDAAPITDITYGEATLYAWWLGKSVADQNPWQGAERTLGPAFAALWSAGLREWGGYGADEDDRIRIGADTWDHDPYDHDDDDDDDDEMIVGALAHLADTGFRTAAPALGLLRDVGVNLPTSEPIALARMFPR